MFRTLLVVSCLLAIASAEPTISVKVQRVDVSKSKVEFLLPMHHAVIVAAYPADRDAGVLEGEFYSAKLIAGRINTTAKNGLEVQAAKKRRILFRVLKISFLGSSRASSL